MSGMFIRLKSIFHHLLTVKNMENQRCKTVWQSNPSGQNGFALPVWISFRFNVHSLTDNKREPNRPHEFPQYGKKGVGFFNLLSSKTQNE